MAHLLQQIIATYHYLNDELSDPRVVDYPLMRNPVKMLTLLTIYLYFVLSWGPKFMEKRKPFNLDRLLIVFNVAQIVICSYMFISVLNGLIPMKHNWLCQPMDYSTSPHSMHLVHLTYCYFLTKILDLFDTLFFVLRKKDNQVTFLHVYHHGGMLVLSWIAVKYLPGGHNVTVGVINTFVHIAMYSYYLLSALDPKYKNNVWWKKHITQLQLIQFFILAIHFTLLFFIDCGFPLFTAYFMIPQNLFMVAMFGDFYYRSYIKPLKSTSGITATPNPAAKKSEQQANGKLGHYLDAMTSTFGGENYHEITENRSKSD